MHSECGGQRRRAGLSMCDARKEQSGGSSMNRKHNKRGGTNRCPLSFMCLSISCSCALILSTFYLRLWRVRSGYFLGVGSLIW